MKKLFFALLIVVASGLAANAQRPANTGRQAISKQVLMDSLNLSDVAADSVIAIRNASMAQIRTIMSDEQLSQEEKREKAKPVALETKEKLKKYLTDEQIEKIRRMEVNKRRNGMNRSHE